MKTEEVKSGRLKPILDFSIKNKVKLSEEKGKIN